MYHIYKHIFVKIAMFRYVKQLLLNSFFKLMYVYGMYIYIYTHTIYLHKLEACIYIYVYNISRIPVSSYTYTYIYTYIYIYIYIYIYDIQFTQENKIYNHQALKKYVCTWEKIKIKK